MILATPSMLRRLLPFAVFLTAFTVVMTILFLSLDMKALKHHPVFNLSQDLDFSSVVQDNPQFIAYVRAVHLQSPSAVVNILENSSVKNPPPQSLLVAKLLSNKMYGTFVETGAYRHGRPSDTEWLEQALGWNGLLIQPDPWDYIILRRQKRKRAAFVHACLSPTPYPKEVTFKQLLGNEVRDIGAPTFTRVKCFPLFSLLLAANLTRVDYLSLDAEGVELQVLKTLPLSHVDIHIISIRKNKLHNESLLIAFMQSHRYKLIDNSSCYIFKLDNSVP